MQGPDFRALRIGALARGRYIAVTFIFLMSAPVPTLGQRKPEPEESDINTKRQEWFFGMRAYPRGFIPGTARLKALERVRQMAGPAPRSVRQSATVSSSQWTSIGPQPINTYSQLNAGRIWALGVDPGNTAVAYAGTDGGGVWKTTNGGTTWAPLTDQQASLGITSLALDPSNSAVIYAGTGGSAAIAAGILKSTDGGNTWTQITGPFLPADEYPLQVSAIAVNAGNDQIVLAGASGYGIYRSTDAGATWTSVLPDITMYEVFFDPSNTSNAYATVYGQGVYKSTDTGQTWSLINGSGTNALPIASMGAINIAISPSSPGTIYAALKNSSNDLLLGFYKTTNGGNNWLPIAAPPNDNVDYWNWSLRVHPTNPNVVFAGSLLLSRSLDGGNTWTDVGDEGPPFIHVDQHSQVFSPDGNTLYIGNDGGVWSTTGPSASSITWIDLNTTFATTLFYPGLSINPTNVNIAFAGAQDNGTEYYQGNLSWNEVACGDGGWTAIDFVNPQNVYATCQEIDIWKSTDGGTSWNPAQNGINTTDDSQFIPPFVMDPSNSLRLYFGASRVYQTTDGASSWSAISGDLAEYGLTAIAVAPSGSNTVYAGGYGQLYVTTNALSGANATWSSIMAGLPDLSITQIAVNPNNSLVAYVTLSGFNFGDGGGHVYQTTNGGLNWTNVSGDLPDIPVNDLVIDPDTPNTLYVATDIGVFRTVDAGESWLPLASGLPYVVVNSLKLHEPTRTLRAATYGRGAWDLWIPVGNQVPIGIASSPSGAPFQLDDGTTYQAPVTFSWTPGTQHTVTWLESWTGLEGARYVFENWMDGGTNPRTITVPSSSTTYTANITAQYLLSLAVTPASAGQLAAVPSSTDGYYNSGVSVQVQATPSAGYGFWYFSGGASGSTNPVGVTIAQPVSVTGNFYCALDGLSYPPYSTSSDGTSGLFDFSIGAGCAWTAVSDSAWLTINPASGADGATLQYVIAANPGAARTGNVIMTYNGTWTAPYAVNQDAAGSQRATVVSLSPVAGAGLSTISTAQFSAPGGYGQVSTAVIAYNSTDSNSYCEAYLVQSPGGNAIVLGDDLASTWPTAGLPGSGTLSVSRCSINVASVSVSGSGDTLLLTVPFQFATTFGGTKLVNLSAGTSASNGWTSVQQMGSFLVGGTSALLFISTPPCRVVDTRDGTKPSGFGPPNLAGEATRSFAPPNGACGIPATAQAYSMNVTVVPDGPLGYLTVWPTGQSQPFVSTLNSLDGAVQANAAVVAAGTGGAISVFATSNTNLVLDINGYFVPATDSSALGFYPMAPCRLVDTRPGAPSTIVTGSLPAGTSTTLPILSSSCHVPSAAQAYSLNFTLVPPGPVSYLTVYPTGESLPVVSTMNDLTGTVVANAAIAPAGTGGSIEAYVTQTTNLVVDINGYFAPVAEGALSLYALPPCRVLDTRTLAGVDPFAGAINVDVIGSGCGGTSAAQGYVFNATVVPDGPLGYLTLWPQGSAQPLVSTLNAEDGDITSNMAIVPTSSTEISAFASNSTNLVLDLFGYFAP